MRSVVIDITDYDWEGDRPLNQPMNEMVIYEMHVGGFTRHASSGVAHPGTFSAIIEKIPYLKELGITAVELLPVMEFDRKEVLRMKPDLATEGNPLVGRGPLTNYWGYSTVSFFAPESSYCVSPEEGTHIREFRDLVKALHRAGIAVILDTVFNHTSEGNHLGPTINFKGFCNEIAYHLSPSDRQYYMDYSGCGNTVNCNHPVVQKFIIECLEFWVKQMHVDGFRFDEGSILSRGEDGGRWSIRRWFGASSFPMPWPTRRLLPRPGTRPACTRSATFPVTAGRSGTAVFAMTSAVSSAAIRDWLAPWLRGSRAAPISTRPAATCPSTA